MNNYLISGTSSGLGRFLYEELQGNKWLRNASNTTEKYNNIIHCAHGGCTDTPLDYFNKAHIYYNFISYNKYNKFIYISSIDVYPKNKELHAENELIDSKNILGIYGITKLSIEQRIQRNHENHLILRCGALLGKYTPQNNIRKAVEGGNITISHKSTFNLIRYKQVLDFIQIAIDKDLTGIYNIVANDNIKFKEISHVKTKGFKYITPNISYQKLLQVAPHLVQPSYFNYQNWINTDL